MLGTIINILPSLIMLAEKIFGKGNGAGKKELIMSIFEKAFDKLVERKVIPDLAGVDEKVVFMSVISEVIDSLVPRIIKK